MGVCRMSCDHASNMKTSRPYLPLLLAVGALLGCILACRPGFSPDGNSVLFSTFDEEARFTYVRVYDRKTEKVRTLRELSWPESAKSIYAATTWSPSGSQVGLLWMSDEGTNLHLEILEAESGRRVRSSSIPVDNSAAVLLHPPVFTDQFLLFGGKEVIRLSLKDGQIERTNMGAEKTADVCVFNGKNEICYYATSQGSNATTFEFGIIDAQQLKLIPKQNFSVEDADGIPGVSRDGKVALWKKPGAIQTWNQGKVEKTLEFAGTNMWNVGSVQWSADQKSILAVVFKDRSGESGDIKSDLGLMEIPLDGSAVQHLKLGGLNLEADEVRFICQSSLSPDGKAIAIGTPFGSVAGASQPTALFLVDLVQPKRPVKRVNFRSEIVK